MPDKVLVNLATGLEDGERVLVAFLVATAAVAQGKQVVVWATKDAVRLSLPDEMKGVVCKGCPPLERLLDQFVAGGGELWVCPDLPRRPRPPGRREDPQREGRRCDADVGVGRQRHDRLQLLKRPPRKARGALPGRRRVSV